jgi:hypothetical protein
LLSLKRALLVESGCINTIAVYFACRKLPTPDDFEPASDISMLDPEDFLQGLRQSEPKACLLQGWEEYKEPPFPVPPLTVTPTTEAVKEFVNKHKCQLPNECECAQIFLDSTVFTDTEINCVELETRGQHLSANWHTMRKGMLTATTVKKVTSSTNFEKTANAILSDKKDG